MTIGRKIVGIKTELGEFPKSFIGYIAHQESFMDWR